MDGRTPFAAWLRQRRNLLDLTQAELAVKSDCSPITIRKLEAGERKPSRELAALLADALRIPARERDAFIQFARSDGVEPSFHLPAWDPQQMSWRATQLPASEPPLEGDAEGLLLHYDLVATDPPLVRETSAGRQLVEARASGAVTGALEGRLTVRITQVIVPKPPGATYAQALPMPVGASFKLQMGEEALEGTYTGIISPMLDAGGNGQARVQATGQIIAVTPAFIDLFLNYVFVEDLVKMVEGTGTGASGTMQLKPAP
jgi:transcriptional regulator with XRE-family HTH domain